MLTDGNDTLAPVRLARFRDTIFVTYRGEPRIDIYDNSFNRLGSLALTQPVTVRPTALAVTDSALIVADHSRHAVVIYERSGRLLTSFDRLPDSRTLLSPFALTAYGGVLYVADARQKQVLAISLTDAPGITEKGELIMALPADSANKPGFPSAVMVTPDGRLLIGDAASGTVDVFTCDGRYVYRFDDADQPGTMGPQGFDIDNVLDPALQDSTHFDPSNVNRMGRIHIVDAANGLIHIYNALGRYVLSYPRNHRLQRPSSIVIDTLRQSIYVADPTARRVYQYRYQKEPA